MKTRLLIAFTVIVAIPAHAWDFRDEVYTCTTQGMTPPSPLTPGISATRSTPAPPRA